MDGIEPRLQSVERDVAVIKSAMATRADVESVRAEIAKGNASTSRWLLGTILTIFGTIAAGVIALASLLIKLH